MSDATVRPGANVITLEELAFRAWPAERVIDVDGWLVRLNRGVTRRANSVWAVRCRELLMDAERIDRVEAIYAREQQPVYVQCGEQNAPAELDALLEQRGYSREAPVSIELASCTSIAECDFSGVEAEVRDERSRLWEDLAARDGRFADVSDVFLELVGRLGAAAGHALARVDGEPAAVALGVHDGDHVGLFAMKTLGRHRRRGAARALVSSLAAWARRRGAHSLYLQVEEDNAPARKLYGSCGFRHVYGYHYRKLAQPGLRPEPR